MVFGWFNGYIFGMIIWLEVIFLNKKWSYEKSSLKQFKNNNKISFPFSLN